MASAAPRFISPEIRTMAVLRLGQLAGLALGLAAMMLLLALLTYNPQDPSFNTATSRLPTNSLGATGAKAADVLIQMFGVAAALPGLSNLPARQMTPERALPVNAWSLQSVYNRSLQAMAGATFWWTFSIAAYAVLMVCIVVKTEEQLRKLYESSPVLAGLIGNVSGGNANTKQLSVATTRLEHAKCFERWAFSA